MGLTGIRESSRGRKASKAICKPVKDVYKRQVVASGRANLKYAVAQLKNGNIERTAAKVEDQNLFILVGFVETVSKSRCRRLIDDTHNLETSDLACVLGCLTLSVVEVSRNSDNCLSCLLYTSHHRERCR